SRLAKEGVGAHVAGRQRGGMRAGRPFPGGGAAALDREDRLFLADPAGKARKPAGVTKRLKVKQDDVRLGIVLPKLQQVVARNISLVADADKGRKAEPESPAVFDDGKPQRPALRGHPDPPGQW